MTIRSVCFTLVNCLASLTVKTAISACLGSIEISPASHICQKRGAGTQQLFRYHIPSFSYSCPYLIKESLCVMMFSRIFKYRQDLRAQVLSVSDCLPNKSVNFCTKVFYTKGQSQDMYLTSCLLEPFTLSSPFLPWTLFKKWLFLLPLSAVKWHRPSILFRSSYIVP